MSERDRGFSRPVQRSAPTGLAVRKGGTAPIPPRGSTGALFAGNVADLQPSDIAQPGWCLRVASEITTSAENALKLGSFNLLVELHLSTGGVDCVMEVDAFPGFTMHIAADTVAGKLKWEDSPYTHEATGLVSWQLTRGICATTATRSFPIGLISYPPDPKEGLVPQFATHFSLHTPDDLRPYFDQENWENTVLTFKTSQAGASVSRYANDALLSAIGEFIPIPRGGRYWDFAEWTTSRWQVVFGFGALP